MDISATAGLAGFMPEGGAPEFHLMIGLTDKHADAPTQYRNIEEAVRRAASLEILHGAALVLKRYFVSDAVNQAEFLTPDDSPAAVSIVQQPPLNGTKVALWLYFTGGGLVERDGGATVLHRPPYRHVFDTQLHDPEGDERRQTGRIFRGYAESLRRRGCTLADNCIRTWIYVQGVDVHYAGMVEARTACFTDEGLTKSTHYIASTGIEGKHTDPRTLVLMDAYAVCGLERGQVGYLNAPTHLNPTYEYGVTFERGTTVDYGDRRHVFISGTASIDNAGGIVHPCRIIPQTQRTMENIGALLAEAGTSMDDVAQMIVYLRDTADYEVVNRWLEVRYPLIPKVLVWAPVCRPGWLIEIECIAVGDIESGFAAF